MLAAVAAVCALLAAGGLAHAQAAVPAAPTGLTASAVAHDSVTLSWDDPGDSSITGYRILRRDVANQDPGDFSAVELNTGSAATTYTDNKVSALKRYAYRVKAINSEGPSGQSNYVNVETPAAPVSPLAPASHDQGDEMSGERVTITALTRELTHRRAFLMTKRPQAETTSIETMLLGTTRRGENEVLRGRLAGLSEASLRINGRPNFDMVLLELRDHGVGTPELARGDLLS